MHDSLQKRYYISSEPDGVAAPNNLELPPIVSLNCLLYTPVRNVSAPTTRKGKFLKGCDFMKELELIAYCLSLMSEEDYSLMLAFMAGATFKRLETSNK